MPNLARLISSGVRGNLATIYPALSPMLWTSIATGKRPYKHGIHGFAEPLPDGSGIRPITNLARTTKAIWNILNQTGRRSIVSGWWPSHPAEPINGVMISNHFQLPSGIPGQPGPLPPGTVHPPEMAGELADLRVNPMEIEGEIIRLFVPEYERVDQQTDKQLHGMVKTLAETMSSHAVAMELIGNQDWDFAAAYYDGLDHFSHGFMRYHPPKPEWVRSEEFEIYRHVINNAYRYHDSMLGGLLSLADENTTVVLLSDHGFQSDRLRPSRLPSDAAGPAYEHRHFGVLCMAGPGLRKGETIHGASILDICPTILTMFGLPPGRDMDGKVLVNAFCEPPQIEPIASWDQIPGEDGRHPKERQLDAAASLEAFKQLVELGYVAPPAQDARQDADEAVRELKFNLARAWKEGGHPHEAAKLAEELWERWPAEHRCGLLLIECLTELNEVERRGEAVARLQERIEHHRSAAMEELARRGPPAASASGGLEFDRAEFERRRLVELTNPGTLTLEWLMASQALLEGRKESARRQLLELAEIQTIGLDLLQGVARGLLELDCNGPAEVAYRRILDRDPQNPAAMAQLARVHFNTGRFEVAAELAADSLELLYFQPTVHTLLGRALMKLGEYQAAETELKVAVAQNPRMRMAHDYLAELYRDFLQRPIDAIEHEGRANVVRYERQSARHASRSTPVAPVADGLNTAQPIPLETSLSEPFAVEAGRVITVVSGLPRSGTSLMMQILAAGGLPPLTDSMRQADIDNPRGYFEFGPATALDRDQSWLPTARGKAVKVVAQLLPYLPGNECVQVIMMRRDLREVVASQRAMLRRLERAQASLSDAELMETFARQLEAVRGQVAGRQNVRWLTVDFGQLLANPSEEVRRLGCFLGSAFQTTEALRAIRPELRRQAAD